MNMISYDIKDPTLRLAKPLQISHASIFKQGKGGGLPFAPFLLPLPVLMDCY